MWNSDSNSDTGQAISNKRQPNSCVHSAAAAEVDDLMGRTNGMHNDKNEKDTVL